MTIYRTVAGSETSYEVPLIEEEENFFFRKVRSFVDAVKDGGEPSVPSSQIIINQAIIDGIVKSAELGKEIDIVIPEI